MQGYQDQHQLQPQQQQHYEMLNNTRTTNEMANSQLVNPSFQNQYRAPTPQQRPNQFTQQQLNQLQQQQQQQQLQQQQQQLQQLQQQQQHMQTHQHVQQQFQQLQQAQQLQIKQQVTQQHIPLEPSLQQTNHWRDQLQLLETSRKSNVTHFYARHAAMNSRRGKADTMKTQSLVEVTKVLLESEVKEQAKQKRSHDEEESGEGDIDEDLIPRIKLKSFPDQLWGALDLSGQNLPMLSSNLFKYEFLTKLYLNGNNLTHIPKEIKNLKHLRVLDLSNNQLTSIPYEMGLLFHMKYLYLFDNNLKTLPQEFGNLIELNFLGIEGNPSFDLALAKILAQKGTRSLILHLRDNVPITVEEPTRKWIKLNEDQVAVKGDDGSTEENNPEDVDETDNDDTFTVYTHNILCHHYATVKMFPHTPSWALNWDYRSEIIKKQLLASKADIICLQEVEAESYEQLWTPLFVEHGYKGLFQAKNRSKRFNAEQAKRVDGCAVFFKTDVFSLYINHPVDYTQLVLTSNKYEKTDDVFNRFQSRDNVGLITVLTHKKTGEKLVVANTHLHWDPAYNDVKAVQAGVLVHEMESVMSKLSNDPRTVPMLICGDFNSTLDSAVYEFLSSGFSKEHADINGRNYGSFTEQGFSHPFNLRSAYDHIGHTKFTNFTPNFTDVLDYVFYTPGSLQVKGLLGGLDDDYTDHFVGLPNIHLGSDHLSLFTKFKFNKRSTNIGNISGGRRDVGGSGRSRKT